jgi:hypothetical protein
MDKFGWTMTVLMIAGAAMFISSLVLVEKSVDVDKAVCASKDGNPVRINNHVICFQKGVVIP